MAILEGEACSLYMVYSLDHSNQIKCSLTDQPGTGWDINLLLPKVVKQNGAHELFMNACVVVGQRYYYIDTRPPSLEWTRHESSLPYVWLK